MAAYYMIKVVYTFECDSELENKAMSSQTEKSFERESNKESKGNDLD